MSKNGVLGALFQDGVMVDPVLPACYLQKLVKKKDLKLFENVHIYWLADLVRIEKEFSNFMKVLNVLN